VTVDTDPTSDKLRSLAYFAMSACVLGELQGHKNPAWAEGLWAILLATVVAGVAEALRRYQLIPVLLVSSLALTIVRLPATVRRTARQN